MRSVLLVRLRVGLGDLLCTVPAVRALRAARADLHVALATWPEMAGAGSRAWRPGWTSWRVLGRRDEVAPQAGWPVHDEAAGVHLRAAGAAAVGDHDGPARRGSAGTGAEPGAGGRSSPTAWRARPDAGPVGRGRYGRSMACRITELVLDCSDPEALSRWWCEVLDWVELDRDGDGSIEIGPTDRSPTGVPTLVFNRSSGPRRGKLPLHLDVNATDRDQHAELERLLGLGARQADVGQTGEESWHVLQDPEGNEFCLLRRQVAPLPGPGGTS